MDTKIRIYKKRFTNFVDGIVNVSSSRSMQGCNVLISARDLEETFNVSLNLTPDQARTLAKGLIDGANFAEKTVSRNEVASTDPYSD